MQIYFHSRLCSYLPRVPILVERTVYIHIYTDHSFRVFPCLQVLRMNGCMFSRYGWMVLLHTSIHYDLYLEGSDECEYNK